MPRARAALPAIAVALASLSLTVGQTGCASGELDSPRLIKKPTGGPPPPLRPASGSDHWPSFRGSGAGGVADGQDIPEAWNGETGKNVRWKVRIPGLAHSSPAVWGERLYVTTAVSSATDPSFKPGLYGSGAASEDRSEQRWIVLALDKRTGETLWERTAHSGVPRDKRHIKASYANSSPATDGRFVVALFGSEGLYVYDVDGNLQWSKNLGRLNAGAYDAPDYEWGSASSPVLHDDLVLVQCDTQAESFVLAADVHSGETVWEVERDEPPSWGTPTVVEWPAGDVLVTNASRYIRGYDVRTGAELWRLGGSSMITAPTPIYDDTGLVIVASGRRPEKPIFAVRPGARGDITLAAGQTSSDHVAWSWTGRGPYMPTPILYDGLLYVLNNDGVFACYDVASGEEVYRVRIPHHGSGFSASPVAADGRIYLPGEDGEVFVIRAGREFELLRQNSVPELIMATPAISDGSLFIRAKDHLYAIGS
jgi:outer membrane protein assembly factor BamB